jgi:uncharacterized membrane-anchored protein
MINIDRKWLIAGLAVASLQTAAIGWIVWDRISLLKNGREIVLPIVPVDPRSLFRGDYVILSYPVSSVPAALMTPEFEASQPSAAYVTLTKKGDAWEPTALSAKPPAPTPDTVMLKARPRFGWSKTSRPREIGSTAAVPPEMVYTVRYGLESYFVPEGTGRALEKVAMERKLAAVIAVDAKGNSAIKGLMIDGKLQYEEPLL